MIGTGNPSGVKALHAVIARERVHDRLVERMAHVQRACHVRWGQLDGEIFAFGSGFCAGLARAACARAATAALFPFGSPLGFKRARFERFGEGVEAGLGGLRGSFRHPSILPGDLATLSNGSWLGTLASVEYAQPGHMRRDTMKGIVFTEFLDMVSERYGDRLVDDIIDDAQLPHGGAYTSVGTYPHTEMVALVDAMSQRTGVNLEALLEIFGHHLFGRFYARYPAFMDSTPDALDFLMGIETIVHTEVRKLYPDAQLPQFETQRVSDHQIKMHYHSVHDFSALAVGLIHGCAQHYKCELQIHKSPAVKLSDGVAVDFVVSRND